MKSNIDKVYSKLPNKKHNFKNHKVELGALDEDANAALKIVFENADVLDELEYKSQDLDKKLDEVLSMFYDFEIKSTLSYNRLNSAEEEIKDVMQRYEAASEEIGIDPTEVKLYRELQNGLTNTSAYKNWAADNTKELSSIPAKIIDIQNIMYDLYN